LVHSPPEPLLGDLVETERPEKLSQDVVRREIPGLERATLRFD
jgi:hypothetical protein